MQLSQLLSSCRTPQYISFPQTGICFWGGVRARFVPQVSIVFVEYPKELSRQVRDSIGPLRKVKDRKYGRTYVAVYAGASAEDEAELNDPFLSGML